jgi:hypothetical protein
MSRNEKSVLQTFFDKTRRFETQHSRWRVTAPNESLDLKSLTKSLEDASKSVMRESNEFTDQGLFFAHDTRAETSIQMAPY